MSGRSFFQAKKWKTETKAMTILKIPKLKREFEQCSPSRQCVILCNSTLFSSSKQAATFFNVRSKTALKISYESQGYIYEWIVCRLINYFRVQVELNRFEEENFKTHSYIHLHGTFLL